MSHGFGCMNVVNMFDFTCNNHLSLTGVQYASKAFAKIFSSHGLPIAMQ